jgi:glycosyltransferase involved in cell wall biosynthesis
MKVLFDHQTFTLQQYGGISRYYFELLIRFNQKSETAETSVLLSNNEYLNSSDSFKTKTFFPGKMFKYKVRLLNSINIVNSIVKLTQDDFQIFHPTYYDPYFLKFIKNKPFVVTFLDMIHERYQDRFDDLRMDKKIYSNKKRLLESATRVIAISESTKRDIMDIYGVDGSNIDVIYLGSSVNITEKGSDRLHESPYLLFVGNRGSYKNFARYLESIASILRKENLCFVCAGGGPFTAEELKFIDTLGLKDLVKFYRIDDVILTNLYSNAVAFVFPSLYEGFGIPVLEAFSTNCPCLLSDGGSLKEVGGDAALYFDGDDPASMYNNLDSFLSSASLRDELIQKGQERLKMFSWDKTYEQTMDVYKSII